MKIALIQMNSTDDKAANLEQARRLIEDCMAKENPDWIGLPEVFSFLGGSRKDKVAAAEEFPDGAAYQLMRELAARHRVHIHAGSMLEHIRGEERLGNTTVVFNRFGENIARYRKIHMFDVTTPDGMVYRESDVMKPGDSAVTYDCEGLTIGCAICDDVRCPALFDALSKCGADLIVLPAAFTLQTGKDHWEVLCRARAIETQTYFAAPAQTGQFRQGAEMRSTYGHTLVADPWGLVIARASDGIGYTTAQIDRELIKRVRAQIPVAQHKVDIKP